MNRICLVVGCVLLVASLMAWGKERTVALEQLPAAVRAAIEQAAQGGTIAKIEVEEEDGATVYEAEIVKDGKKMEIEVSSAGVVLEREQEDDNDENEKDEDNITWADLPVAVQQALTRHRDTRPNALEIERRGKCMFYEAEYSEGHGEHSVKLTADGDIVEVEDTVQESDMPAEVRAAIVRIAPNATMRELERKTITVYSVELVVDGKKKDVELFANGCPADDD